MLTEIWNYKYLRRIDFRAIVVVLSLMTVSLMIMSSVDYYHNQEDYTTFTLFTPLVKSQLRSFGVGWVAFIFFVGFDYNKLREWTWIIYAIIIVCLAGLFFVGSMNKVNRWYWIPGINMAFQPSEYAKLTIVLALSWFLERCKGRSRSWTTVIGAGLIAGVPFLMILKQPDLGTALALIPIVMILFYFGDIHPLVLRIMSVFIVCIAAIVVLFFSGAVSHEEMRPYMTKVIKNYQYERLNPDTHHQRAAVTAIALGGVSGKGWHKSEYVSGGWLPAPHTDSVFSVAGEEFGLLGLLLILILFYTLIYFSFQVSAVAKDSFGCFLAAGVAVYLAVHIVINIGMMCGFLPITGVPLVMITYGGSSVLTVMIALGILQSIYSRRFMF